MVILHPCRSLLGLSLRLVTLLHLRHRLASFQARSNRTLTAYRPAPNAKHIAVVVPEAVDVERALTSHPCVPLQDCPDCGREISTNANACPGCGCRLVTDAELVQTEMKLGCFAIVMILCVAALIWAFVTGKF